MKQPLTVAGALLHITLVYMVSVIVFDIAGVAAVFLAEVLLSRARSEMLFYAIWLVAAIFNGAFFLVSPTTGLS